MTSTLGGPLRVEQRAVVREDVDVRTAGVSAATGRWPTSGGDHDRLDRDHADDLGSAHADRAQQTQFPSAPRSTGERVDDAEERDDQRQPEDDVEYHRRRIHLAGQLLKEAGLVADADLGAVRQQLNSPAVGFRPKMSAIAGKSVAATLMAS
jgi:hypothetical protein